MGAIAVKVELAEVDSAWELDDVGPYRTATLELMVAWDDGAGPALVERHKLGPFVALSGEPLDESDPGVQEALEALEVADDLTGLDLVRGWAYAERMRARLDAAMDRAAAAHEDVQRDACMFPLDGMRA
jgi:hypothetical protein